MGQKVNPIALRLGIIKTWNFKWYSKKKYASNLHEDLKIRSHVLKQLKHAEVANVEIIRYLDRMIVNILTSRPGLVIGKKGSDIERLKGELKKITDQRIHLNIQELSNPNVNANLVSQSVARQLESRGSYKKVMKRAISNAMKGRAKGVRIMVSGRLGGLEMARREQYREGGIPLHTLRADVDYGFCESKTKFGIIGVKVWVFKEEVLKNKKLIATQSVK